MCIRDRIISNYNIINSDDKFENNTVLDVSIKYDTENIKEELVNEKESNRVISNSSTVNYAIILLFVIFVLLLLEPIYIDT